MNSQLLEIKQQLFEALGDEKEKKYLQFLRNWLLGRLTRQEFEAEAYVLTTNDFIHLHNTLILEILNRGFSGTSSPLNRPISDKYDKSHHTSSKRKRGTSKTDTHKNFPETKEETEFTLPNFSYGTKDLSFQTFRFAADELFLPDVEMVIGRFNIAAWTEKLVGADSQIAEIVIQAVQIYLKNIITSILTRFRGYKVRKNNVVYNVGANVPNPWLRNTALLDDFEKESNINVPISNCVVPTLKPTPPEMEMKSLFSYACSNNKIKSNNKITMQHLYHAFKNNPRIIGNHTIFSTHLEKITLLLRNAEYQ